MRQPACIEELLFTWKGTDGDARIILVEVEDDVRDALQCVSARRPTVCERARLLELSAQIGVQVSFVGFPAASPDEQQRCTSLVRHIENAELPLRPVLMARAEAQDLAAVIDVQQSVTTNVTVDLYIATSELRTIVEGWTTSAAFGRLRDTAQFAHREGLDFRIAFEDSTRTSPERLREAIAVALDCGATCIVLNDTVGACLPAGARQHVAFARAVIAGAGCEDVTVAWHGHNDKGLSLANALAAVEGGATLVSGTFLGVGERAGNIPLEQFLVLLASAGHTGYRLDLLHAMCCLTASVLGVPLAHDRPAVGRDVFTTGTGTHAAAILKARQLGPGFEDVVYSGVSALALGRSQRIVVGPNSGRAAARAALESAAIPSDDKRVRALLEHCRRSGKHLRDPDDIRRAAS